MRNLTQTWKDYLASGGTSLAMCIKVTLKSGAVYAFTTASSDIPIGGVTYKPSMGMTPSAITTGEDMSPGNMEAVGFFSAEGVLLDDVRAGKFDGATHETIIVNYDNLSMGPIAHMEGPLGLIRSKGNQFNFELKDWLDLLGKSVGERTTPYCRYKRLGQTECGIQMNPSFKVTTLAIDMIDSAGQLDVPIDTIGVFFSIMNDGRIALMKLHASNALSYAIVDPDTFETLEILPTITAAQSVLTGFYVNQYGDMFTAGCYKRHDGVATNYGIDFFTRCFMDLDGRFYVACRYEASPYRPAIVIIETNGAFRTIDLPTDYLPYDMWLGFNGYLYVSMTSGTSAQGPLYKIDIASGSIVKQSAYNAFFHRFVVASDDSVYYTTNLGVHWIRMSPSWDSEVMLHNYFSAPAFGFHEAWGRNWATGGALLSWGSTYRSYAADGTLLESLPFVSAGGTSFATHPNFPDRIYMVNTVPFNGFGNRFAAKVYRKQTGASSSSWIAGTGVTVWRDGDAKFGSVAKPTTFNGFYYVCIQTGTTGTVEPTWPTTLNAEITDGTAKWKTVIAKVWPRTVLTVSGNQVLTFTGSGTPTTDVFKYGICRWLTGANAGLESEIMTNDASGATLYIPPPNDIQIGDTCEIEIGCNRSAAACQNTFFNMHNFGGEPHKPSADFMMSYTTR